MKFLAKLEMIVINFKVQFMYSLNSHWKRNLIEKFKSGVSILGFQIGYLQSVTKLTILVILGEKKLKK